MVSLLSWSTVLAWCDGVFACWWTGRWWRRRKLRRLEAATRQELSPEQFETLRSFIGQIDRAERGPA